MKSVLSEYKFSNETVSFWTWISASTIAIVTENSVYHWSMQGSNSKPKKIFDKMEKIQEATIINYKTSSDEKWCLLIGLTKVVIFYF
jgi:clathrin heavy chain